MRGQLVILPALLLWLAFAPLQAEPQQTATGSQVIAAFLYNVTNFIAWPNAQGSRNAAFELCVWGESMMAFEFQKAVSGRSVGTRPIVVRQVSTSASLKSCQVVFFDGDSNSAVKLLESLRELPVLTVGASPEFTQKGGMVQFFIDGSRMKFRINVQAVEDANLKISSKLLALAQIVGKDH
jgi:hypothetical protein